MRNTKPPSPSGDNSISFPKHPRRRLAHGISLEYCCIVGERPQGSAIAEGGFTIRRAALDLGDALAADIAKAKTCT
jgi:hypothetical protein